MVLTQPDMLIGRDETTDFVLEDEYVSHRHARVITDPAGLVTITDLESSSGTFVNEERLSGSRVLQPDDLVRFAGVVARFEPHDSAVLESRPEKITRARKTASPPRTRATSAAKKTPAQPAATAVAIVEPGPTATAGTGGNKGHGGDGSRTAGGDAYTVTGTVSSPVLPAMSGLAVHLLDYNVGAEPTTLATTNTANDGSYTFDRVVIAASYLRQHHKPAPDLHVQVSANGGPVLGASSIAYQASTTEKLVVCPVFS
jgi:hypothetical protein